MKERIPATFRFIEGGAYLQIDTPHFKGQIIVSDFVFAANGNPVLPGIGECVDGDIIEVSFDRAEKE